MSTDFESWDRSIKDHYLTVLRDRETSTGQFRWASDRIAALLCSEAMSRLPANKNGVRTPVASAEGSQISSDVMILPIYRAGQSLVQAFMDSVPGIAVGSLLIQRDEKTAQPKLFYNKLPSPLPKYVIIIDPMLATAGTAVMAVQIMKDAGYSSDNIHFMGIIASREGYDRLSSEIPAKNITVATIDPILNGSKYIVPGLGDYGDRYFGT